MKDNSQALLPGHQTSRGTNAVGLRLYNERLVLSLIRKNGSLPKAEIARQTGLTAPAISQIIRNLEQDNLLVRQEKQRGRVGQPSVPFSLNPDGVLSLGLRIGRRSCDFLCVDFTGEIRHDTQDYYSFPEPNRILDFCRRSLSEFLDSLPDEMKGRISGLGISMPYQLWKWEREFNFPEGSLSGWESFDILAELSEGSHWPVYLSNDATAACAAELVFGGADHPSDFLYFFIGWFIGGGIVLDGSLYPGKSGNAGALGSIPVPNGQTAGKPQLIHHASLYLLEKKLIAAGHDTSSLWQPETDWSVYEPELGQWIQDVAGKIAFAITAAISVIDFPNVIIDGAFPAPIRTRLTEAVTQELTAMDQAGLSPVRIQEGCIGRDARAIGGAILPMLASFARDRDVLFKDQASS